MAEDFIKIICERTKGQFESSQYPELCQNVVWSETAVVMRDGIKLKTYICLPQMGQTSYPVIVTRSCYPAQEPHYRLQGEGFARRGYGFVYQYTRGRGGSQGEFVPNVQEREDGIDMINWLVAQPWCGLIGYFGSSYTALAGWAMADAVEGKVASMFLEHYGTDRFVSAYEKGEFRQDILTSWSMENTGEARWVTEEEYLKTCRYMPQTHVDVDLWGVSSPSYQEYIRNTRKSDKFWQSGWWKQLREIPQNTRIPVCITSGWYDHHHGSSMKTWENLGPKSKDHSWLFIGPWNHGLMPCLEGKKLEHMNNETIHRALDWFQMTLKEEKVPQKRVSYYQIGEDRWCNSDDWRTGDDSFVFLFPQGEYTFAYDPQDPVESRGGEALLKSMPKAGSVLQPGPNYRKDVITFISEPLEHSLRIHGKAQVKLYVGSDCEDTAFTAKIMEVTREGRAYNLRSSITTISHDQPDSAPYCPGDVRMLTIDMWDIAYTIPAGSCIRVDISSSDFPQYHIHSNIAGLWSEQTQTKIANQHIFAGGKYPSCVVLPIE